MSIANFFQPSTNNRIICVIDLLETVYAAVESSELTSKNMTESPWLEKNLSKVEKVISLAWLEIVDVDGTEKKVEMCILHLVWSYNSSNDFEV